MIPSLVSGTQSYGSVEGFNAESIACSIVMARDSARKYQRLYYKARSTNPNALSKIDEEKGRRSASNAVQ